MVTPPIALIGVSAAMRAVEEEIQYAARSEAKVLITGESGVGKEIVARHIHQRSIRGNGPLITINCAGFPDSLLETELFGHVKGSFTDAHRNRPGWLESAKGGTIFMDEVGEMSLRMQAALLRFLESGEIQRVGSDRPLPPLDVRVITATHRRLWDDVAANTFREDLYYRLNVINIAVPPLRERREDIYVLLNHFLQVAAGTNRIPIPSVRPEALQRLTDYDWPGNVRELRNVAERLVLRARDGRIDVDALPPELLRHPGSSSDFVQRERATDRADALFDLLVHQRRCFWKTVYEPFMARDLNREEIRGVIALGLEHTRGSYKMLVTAFNMPTGHYKRFLTFLRKHRCHVPYQQYRVLPDRAEPEATHPA